MIDFNLFPNIKIAILRWFFSIKFLWMIWLLIWFSRLLSFHSFHYFPFLLFFLLFINWYLITIFKLIEFQQKVYNSFQFQIIETNLIRKRKNAQQNVNALPLISSSDGWEGWWQRQMLKSAAHIRQAKKQMIGLNLR